jgi:ABC-2 type transport system ATP-binding protein
VLEAVGLKKRYGQRWAVDGLSFTARAGEALGFLGPNGAGKSTTVGMLAGLIVPDEGEVRLEGASLKGDEDPRKALLGLVPQDLALVEELSARENLRLFGALYGLRGAALEMAVDRSLDWVGLRDRAKEPPAAYSGGMKRRLNLGAALLHEPSILLLDEPTVGVDPQSRNALFDAFEALKAAGKTLIYTTHYMEEVERLCDRVVIIDHGRLIAEDTVAGLTRRPGAGPVLKVTLDQPDARAESLRGWDTVASLEVRGAELLLGLDALDAAPAVLARLRAEGYAVQGFATERASLESVFLALTGRSLRDA